MLRRNSSHKAPCKIRVLNRASVKNCLPAFLFQRLHPQCPHDLPHGHSRIFSVLIFSFCVAVEVFLKSIMQVDLIGQPWVYGAPVGRFAFLVVALLDHAQALAVLFIQCTYPVHRMVATVDASVVVRPFLRLSVIVVSHKNKESPQLSPRTLLGSSFLIFFRKASLQLMYSLADCSRQLGHAARLAD